MRFVKLFSLFILLSFCFSSCVRYSFIKYTGTSENGIRIKKPQRFKYNKEKYANANRFKIDTNSIYRIIDWYHHGGGYDESYLPQGALRFFGTGQVLFYSMKKPLDNLVNNSLAGEPGYFMIEGNKIKIHRWTITNGGQLEKYYGILLNDGTIKFYEQAVRYCHGSYKCLEKQRMYAIWEKTNSVRLDHFKPDW